MQKTKIAISMDQETLDRIDARIDNSLLRSRSQAIDYYVKRGLRDETVTNAVLLIKGDHHAISLRPFKGKPFIINQLEFFKENNITTVYIVTQHSSKLTEIQDTIESFPLTTEIIETSAKGNAMALSALKSKLKHSALVMSGDTYHQADLRTFCKKHQEMDNLCTMGLMTRENTQGYGTAILDGDHIIDFKEKPKHSATTIVNAGIYLIKPELFELMDDATSLEKDVFPKLAHLHQLIGCFTYGEYHHATEESA